MSTGYTVTIIGGTGLLGHNVSEAFLTDFRSSFPTVRILTRNLTSAKAQELKSKGAELYKFDESSLAQSLDSAFEGADVIVNTLPIKDVESEAFKAVKNGTIDAVARSGAKIYFVSEFGVDRRINEFPGYDYTDWSLKEEIVAQARSVSKGKKVVSLFTGPFLEFIFSVPFFFDLSKNTFKVYGSPKEKITLTSMKDIGRAIAQISILSLNPATAPSVPDDIRIAGTTLTTEEIRDTVARVKGVEKGTILTEDLAALQTSLREGAPDKRHGRLLDYLRAVLGEGKGDFSSQNDNELVNPGGRLWKWKSAESHLQSL